VDGRPDSEQCDRPVAAALSHLLDDEDAVMSENEGNASL